MTQWMMAHPYLFAGLAVVAMITVWIIAVNICEVVRVKIIAKQTITLTEIGGKNDEQ